MNGLYKQELLSFGLLVIIILLVYTFQPITTTYYISAVTERTSFTTQDKNNSKINLQGVDIWTDDLIPLHTKVDGSLDLNENVRVTIERIGYGDATMTLESETSTGDLILFDSIGQEKIEVLPSFVEIDFKNLKSDFEKGVSQLIRIDGTINLGRKLDYEIRDESTAILKYGEINMIGRTKFFSSTFQAEKKLLQEGDQFVIDKPIGKGFGFVNFDDKPGMNITYRVLSTSGRIVKPGPIDEFGANGYFIKASILDRFKNDALFTSISLIFAVVLVCTTLITFVYDSMNFFKKDKTNNT